MAWLVDPAGRHSALTGGLERLSCAGDNPNRSQEPHEPMANVASAMGLNIAQSALPTIKENVVASDPANQSLDRVWGQRSIPAFLPYSNRVHQRPNRL